MIRPAQQPAFAMQPGGNKVWPAHRPTTRTYSVRAFDAECGILSVDFVVHAPPGHASDWVRRAEPGMVLGVAGPALPPVKYAATEEDYHRERHEQMDAIEATS